MNQNARIASLIVGCTLSVTIPYIPVNAVELPERLQLHSAARPVPSIAFKGPEGEDKSLADFRGTFVVLNVWATWCVPCRKEMPALDQLQSRFSTDDVRVITLSLDRKGLEAVEKFYQDVGVKNLIPYLDISGKALRDLGLVGLPGTVLINRQGREIGRLHGEADWSSQTMITFIAAQAKADIRP